MASFKNGFEWSASGIVLALFVLAGLQTSNAGLWHERAVGAQHGGRRFATPDIDGDAEFAIILKSVGGTEADPYQYPWLATIWLHNPDGQSGNRFAGFIIRLNQDEFVTSKRACEETEIDWAPGEKSPKSKYTRGEQILFQLQREYQFDKIFREVPRKFGCETRGRMLNSEFGIFHLKSYRIVSDASADIEMAPGIGWPPNIQTDPNDTKECFLLTYSGSTDVSAWPNLKRKFSKFSVRIGKCDGDKCQVSSDSAKGRICSDRTDVAAPIMCGYDKPKLSYLVTDQDHGVCTSTFEAFSVASVSDSLKAAIKTRKYISSGRLEELER